MNTLDNLALDDAKYSVKVNQHLFYTHDCFYVAYNT